MTPVPRLRPEVALRQEGARTAILDPRAGKRYVLDGPLHAALAAIDGARDLEALLAIGIAADPSLERDDLEQAIVALDRLSLLEPRALGERPLHFALGLDFSCVACGESCRRWRVGPLAPEDQASIRSVDWRARGLDVPEDPFVRGVDGVYLKKRADGACVFLGADQLCEVHRALGGERKPFVCRLFPFEPLEDEAGIRVLFRLECASLPLALSAGGPSAGAEREVRDLLSRRTYSPPGFPATPFFARSPLSPLPLAPGRTLERAEHDAIRDRALAALGDRSRGPALERFASVARGVARAAASTEGGRVAAFEEGLASRAAGEPDAALALSLAASLRVGLRGAGVIEAWDPDRAEPPAPPPAAQRTANDLPFETRRSRVRLAALLDALVAGLDGAPPRADGAALAAWLEERAGRSRPIPLPATGAPAFRNSGARPDFDADDAHAYALAYHLLRERTILGAGDLVFGYGLLALRFAAARALAALLARLRGRDAPSALDANDAWIDVEAVLRLSHTPELAPPLARFLETESFRLFG